MKTQNTVAITHIVVKGKGRGTPLRCFARTYTSANVTFLWGGKIDSPGMIVALQIRKSVVLIRREVVLHSPRSYSNNNKNGVLARRSKAGTVWCVVNIKLDNLNILELEREGFGLPVQQHDHPAWFDGCDG